MPCSLANGSKYSSRWRSCAAPPQATMVKSRALAEAATPAITAAASNVDNSFIMRSSPGIGVSVRSCRGRGHVAQPVRTPAQEFHYPQQHAGNHDEKDREGDDARIE